ncbi:HNH endonuclease [Cellulosimicrobium sp. 4261]|uniref:HNH endonuclease n=1 Tax=Cellulosimicrobium sp. 4261 TaxID=3156458 RepID=UPI00339A80EC
MKQDLVAKVWRALPSLEENSAHFQGLVHGGSAERCLSANYSTGEVTGKDLQWLYRNHVADSTDGAARDLYHEIKIRGPIDGVCPYCNHRDVGTVDHFVPKSKIPALSIEPWNLVPACMACNKTMLDAFSPEPGEQYLHPYSRPFPISPEMRWLRAEVVPGPPTVVRFRAEPEGSCDPLLAQRIVYEFDGLRLAELYSKLSIKKLNAARSRFIRDSFTADTIREHLQELARTAEGAGANEWEAVLYYTLLASDWYVNGGYLQEDAG